MYLSGVQPEFLNRALKVLGLVPEPDPHQIGFFVSFETYFFFHVFNTMKNGVCTSF
jgi:hypothetical protein